MKELKFERGETVGGVVIGSARESWDRLADAAVADLANLNFSLIPYRYNNRRDEAIIRAGIAEIAKIRLEAAIAPLFGTLRKIDICILAAMALHQTRDPYAPRRSNAAPR